MSEEELQIAKEEKYLAIKEMLKGFTITEATQVLDYTVRQLRGEIKIP